jgi:hypothetical protein
MVRFLFYLVSNWNQPKTSITISGNVKKFYNSFKNKHFFICALQKCNVYLYGS